MCAFYIFCRLSQVSSVAAIGDVHKHTVSPPSGGSEGPNSSSSLLSDSFALLAGSVGLSSRGAGGIAGPITRLRFSPSPGLSERFAPEAVVDASLASSSCLLFRFASRCGGSAGPISDIVSMTWYVVVMGSCNVRGEASSCGSGASGRLGWYVSSVYHQLRFTWIIKDHSLHYVASL